MAASMEVRMGESPTRILIVRADRIGDVVLSTPVIEALRERFPTAHLTMAVRAPIAPLLRGLPGLDEVRVLDPEGQHRGWVGFFRLVRELRAERYSAVVLLQYQSRLAAAFVFARIPLRVGPLSRLSSYLFLNRGLRQRRSQVNRHEAEYNLELIGQLGASVRSKRYPARVMLDGASRAWARDFVAQHGLGSAFIAVHPGMGGSALNWPEHHYGALIAKWVNQGRRVLVTGGPGEAALIARLRASLGGAAESVVWFVAAPSDGLDRLGALFEASVGVVAPSTGPLHVAAALGKPVVGLFPPIRVQSAKRWGPYGPAPESSVVLSPSVECGQDFSCLGPKCRYYPCMPSIEVTSVWEQAERRFFETLER